MTRRMLERTNPITRGVVARGKEKRDAKEGREDIILVVKEGGYRFGGFTRGLFI